VTPYQSIEGLKTRNIRGSPDLFSYPEYQQYKHATQSLAGLTAYVPFVETALTGKRSGLLTGELVTCNYFSVLGRSPRVGRAFTESECLMGGSGGSSAVVVLSESAWRSKFGADPSIVGATIILNRHPFTVVGIGPSGFAGTFLLAADFWAPLSSQPALLPQVDWHDSNLSWLCLLGRLNPGVSAIQAQAELQVIAHRIDTTQPGRRTTMRADTASMISEPRVRKNLLYGSTVVMAGVSLILLIACANVANLLLARGSHRSRELAIRLSVGASRGRIVRQLLTESLLISLAGGALGVLIAHVTFGGFYNWVRAHLPMSVPPFAIDLSIDWRIWTYAFLVSIATGVAFGLVPALESTKLDIASGVKDEFRASGKRTRRVLRSALVGGQVAVSLILCVAAGLLGRGLIAAQQMDPGFTTKNVFAASLDLRRDGYTPSRATVFYDELIHKLQSENSMQAVSLAWAAPLAGGRYSNLASVEGRAEPIHVTFNEVAPSFFRLLNIPIVRGRAFLDSELDENHPVMVVSESTARRLWPGVDPIGKWIRLGDRTTLWRIVGVAKDVYTSSLTDRDDIFLYRTLDRNELNMSILVRGRSTADGERALRAAIHGLDPRLYFEIKTIDQYSETWRFPGKMLTIFSAALGVLGLLLASSGVYGVVNYDVSRRIPELGVRMTLGAKPADVLRLVAVQSLRPVFLGCLVGVALAAAVTRVMSKLLFGVSPLDPLTFAAVSFLLLLAAAIASYAPARRAARIDPMTALRQE
jgi:predicted permease